MQKKANETPILHFLAFHKHFAQLVLLKFIHVFKKSFFLNILICRDAVRVYYENYYLHS